MRKKSVDEWREKVHLVLESKRNEFEMLGYKEITHDDIWRYLKDAVWKDNRKRHLYEVVQSIFKLQIHNYMDYLTLHSLSDDETPDDLMASIQQVMNQNNM